MIARTLRAVSLALGCTALVIAPTADVSACGGFFTPRASETRRPSLSYEQSLIVFDEKKEREHFIRDVTFREADEHFGFVVPTPSRPMVDKLDKSPFAQLRTFFPYTLDRTPRGGGIGTIGHGAGFGSGAGKGVQLIETKKVGRFTAFVLAATDEKALSDWLAKQKLVSTPEADRWLKHYVEMGFYYVAMRYDPPAKSDGNKVGAETVRISFDTPLPYYPYFEPAPPAGAKTDEPRLLELWLVAKSRAVPVAARTSEQGTTWVRPFAEGEFYGPASRDNLTTALGNAKLLPAEDEGEIVVQRFMDQKRSRQGYSDVLFAWGEERKLSDALKKKLGPLLPILDPSLRAKGAAK